MAPQQALSLIFYQYYNLALDSQRLCDSWKYNFLNVAYMIVYTIVSHW